MALIKLNNQSLTAVTSGGLPSGTVLQVVQTLITTGASITSTTHVDSALTVNITPSSTTSKIHMRRFALNAGKKQFCVLNALNTS
jgi:hypothetical protein